jgi:uncharacterized DUF497 family protein
VWACAAAALALEDEQALTRPDTASTDEERYVTLCMDPMGRLLVVAFTFRGESVRLISAREATKREQRQYEVRR